jgi:hypothetical protein
MEVITGAFHAIDDLSARALTLSEKKEMVMSFWARTRVLAEIASSGCFEIRQFIHSVETRNLEA